jgi:hypothetical protein
LFHEKELGMKIGRRSKHNEILRRGFISGKGESERERRRSYGSCVSGCTSES